MRRCNLFNTYFPLESLILWNNRWCNAYYMEQMATTAGVNGEGIVNLEILIVLILYDSLLWNVEDILKNIGDQKSVGDFEQIQ